MRIRSVLLISAAMTVMYWTGAAAASALQIGPVAVPVTVPAPVATSLPTIDGPVVLPAPAGELVPGFGATLTLSATNGVGADVTLPTAIGRVPMLPAAPHDVHVVVGPSGAAVGLSPAPQVSVPGRLPETDSPAATAQSAAPDDSRPDDAGRTHTSTPAVLPSAPRTQPVISAARPGLPVASIEATPSTVGASVRNPPSGGTWGFARDLASAHGLWIALLLIVIAARVVANRMLRNALRESPPVNPA
ncbi:MAG TPA: hypothetical protein VL119_13185 [Acidimicrobiia bacterium]|nr:hypothetical protein [Acidimicrobiia bacterium]